MTLYQKLAEVEDKISSIEVKLGLPQRKHLLVRHQTLNQNNVRLITDTLILPKPYITNISPRFANLQVAFEGVDGLGMRVINSLLDTPNSASFVYAIENSFDYQDELPQGFLICPQAFTSYTQNDRIAVGLAMEAHCSDDQFDWVALIDAGPEMSLTAAQSEGLLYNSPQGHSSFYYPHLIDLEGNIVPPSAAVAGMATRRYQTEGFEQPPAGAKFPLLGVTDVFTKISTQQQETVNPLGINLIRNLRNKGVVVWAMRTRSSNEFYTFLNTRVIMNVLNGTLRRGFDNELFSAIDGQGMLLRSIYEAAYTVCARLWRGKALFGATEKEAFEIKCDFDNNSREELERGNVLLEVYVVPAPSMEKLLINTIRVSIGTLPLLD
ncbi:phage tail sheath protein fi-like protein [Calothrix brevissima NIES-22]|nr:phage tail sheath protein fi-like protein [Calothrix brevissima NIES-22]